MRALKTGTVVGDYRIISEIGSGGLGQVFKAVHLGNHVTVALKLIHDRLYCNKKFIGLLHREMLIHAGLQHRNIVRHYDNRFNPPLCYIATEYIDGWSGSVFIKRNKEVPPLVALALIYQILQGLDYLHLHDKVHADLSAGNFLVERSGRAVLTDFGLSSELQDHKNYLIGTPGYYSPEHITKESVSYASDTYCVGLILYELIAGYRAVVASKNHRLVSTNMRKIAFASLPCADGGMKSILVKLLQRALAFENSKRYAMADRMLFDCHLILGKYNITSPRQAVLKYLVQAGLTTATCGDKQDIYRGYGSSKPRIVSARRPA